MKTLTFACLLAAALVAVPAFGAQTETWTVDPVHSTAQFTARHFGIVPVIGTIPISRASVTLNPGTQIPIAVVAELDVSKLDTHNDKRDGDLRSDHFFNVASTPDMRFVSTKIEGTDPKHFTITGDLTMHGITKTVTLDVIYNGTITHPMSKKLVAGFKISGTFNRSDFGVGGAMTGVLGDEVTLMANAEFVKQ